MHIFEIEQELGAHPQDLEVLKTAKLNGFSDRKIAELWGTTDDQVRQLRLENKIVPVYKMVDTCAAEFDSETPYFYSTYGWENESIRSDKESVLVLGSGPTVSVKGLSLTTQPFTLLRLSRQLVMKLSS